MRWLWRYGTLMRRCRRIDETLDLPEPFDAAELVARLARRRGRPIELIAVPARPGAPCGLLVTAGQADYIVYAGDTPPLHQQHILVHEYAHLLLGHTGGVSLTSGLTQGLLPHLSAGLVERVLGRTIYQDQQEQEAELLASLILTRAIRKGSLSAPGHTPARPAGAGHGGGKPADAESADAERARRLAALVGRVPGAGARG